jgi:hypothetical protein
MARCAIEHLDRNAGTSMRKLRVAAVAVLGRFGILVAAALVTACTSVPLNPSPTPIPAVEATSAASASTSSAAPPSAPGPSSSGGDCLAQASQVVLLGHACLQGTENEATDVTQVRTAQDTLHTIDAVKIDFSLWAVAPGTLKGTAHVSYFFKHVRTGNGKVCEEAMDPNPLTWDVGIEGVYSALPDGRIRVSVPHATPDPGPGYAVTDSCPPGADEPGILWPVLSGWLTAGVYDFHQDWPLPADTTGSKSTTIHIEETDRG